MKFKRESLVEKVKKEAGYGHLTDLNKDSSVERPRKMQILEDRAQDRQKSLAPGYRVVKSPERDTKPTGFLDLPLELKNVIYELVLLPKRNAQTQSRGCTKLLTLNWRLYGESHRCLHDIPQVLRLPLCDDVDSYNAPFRFYKTRYQREGTCIPQLVENWFHAPNPIHARQRFTAHEFRPFSHVTLDMEYVGVGTVYSPSIVENASLFKGQEHALRVMMGSKSLEHLTLSLGARVPWAYAPRECSEQKPEDFVQTIRRLLPFIRLGDVNTKIVAENKLSDSDPVVVHLNHARGRYVHKLTLRMRNETHSADHINYLRCIFEAAPEDEDFTGLLGVGPIKSSHPSHYARSYPSLERERFMKAKNPPLVDIRKLFDCPEYLKRPSETYKPPLLKCYECFLACQTRGELKRHIHSSMHYAQCFLHTHDSGACQEFCRSAHQADFHFKREPNTAFKCPECLSKFNYKEGLVNHMRFWEHHEIRVEDVLEDSRTIFGDCSERPRQTSKRGRRPRKFGLLRKHIRAKRRQPRSRGVILESCTPGKRYGFKCSSCCACFKSRKDFESHAERERRGQGYDARGPSHPWNIGNGCHLLELPKGQSPQNLWRCPNCSEVFDHKPSLLQHIKKVNASRYAEPGHFVSIYNSDLPKQHPTVIECRSCHWAFPSVTQLGRHLERNKGHVRRAKGRRVGQEESDWSFPNLPVEGIAGFECKACKKHFETMNLLQRHLEHERCALPPWERPRSSFTSIGVTKDIRMKL